MEDPRVGELAHLARSSPSEATLLGEKLLVEAGGDDATASRILRSLCEAARICSAVADSVAHGRAAVERALAADDAELVREANLTLSGSLHLSGDVDGALLAIDAAAEGATGVFAAKTSFQRATVLAREGRREEALAGFEAALPVFVAADETRFVALCRQNAGNVRLESGDVVGALADFTEAASLFERLDLRTPAAAMAHNIGRAHGYAGRVADAIRHLDEAEHRLDALTAGSWEIKASKCEILLQAGFHADALALAERAAVELARTGLEFERAEAVLWLAVAALETGDAATAADAADDAATLFRHQGREPWALQADALGLRCVLAAGRCPPVEEASALAAALGRSGHVIAAAWAWSAVAATDPVAALDGFDAMGLVPDGAPLELRLARYHLAASAQRHRGELGPALATTRRGMLDGRRHRSSLGSSDAMAGASAQLERLGRLGLELRLAGGRPESVLRWVEQTRSATTRPLNPPRRSAGIEALSAELRLVQVESRTAGPGEVVDLLRRQARLQRRLTEVDRASSRDGSESGWQLPADLAAAFEGRAVVQYLEQDGHLLAVVFDGQEQRIDKLGTTDDASAALTRLIRAADRFAARPDQRGLQRLHRAAATADERIMPRLTNRPTTIAPLPRDLSVPWSLLPGLAGREVAVAPSLVPPHRAPVGSVGVVLGPGLVTGAGEVERIALLHDRVEVLQGPEASIGATLDLLQRVDIAHVASHGHRSGGDARFAGIQLADGDLTAFDLEGLEQAPTTVVFSGCDAGILRPLPGGEAVGPAGALFQRGAVEVVAATCRLPDDADTSELFVRIHQRLAAGRGAVEALAEVRVTLDDPVAAAVAGLVSCFRLG